MNRNQKLEIIENLTEEFSKASAIIACNYEGHGVSDLEVLRGIALENEVKVQVVKNTLSSIALKNANKEGLEFSNMNIFIWGEDAIATAKTYSKFAEKFKEFEMNTAYIDDGIADEAKVEAFAKLPGREELLGMLASVWMGPIRNFTVGLDQLRQKREEEA